MGYFLTSLGLIVLLIVLFVVMSLFLGRSSGRRSAWTKQHRNVLHQEKEQMNKPQEEFISDQNNKGENHF